MLKRLECWIIQSEVPGFELRRCRPVIVSTLVLPTASKPEQEMFGVYYLAYIPGEER